MLDIIGTLYEPTGEMLQGEDGPYPEMALIPGWHVNSPEPVEGWEAYQVTPTSPRRVFGAHPTFFYVFPDEETFTELALEAGLIQPEPEEPVEEPEQEE